MRNLSLTLFTLLFAVNGVAEPLFWQATKGQLNYYILGSVHVGDDSMFPLNKQIMDALQSSDGLIIETDVRKTQGITYPPATLLSKDVLTPKQQDELSGIANLLELNAPQLLNSPPWATALAVQMKQIEYLGYKAAYGVDAHLTYKATFQEIPVISLESLQFQIDLLTGQKESGKELLLSAIEEFDHSEEMTHCLIKTWKAGDIEKLNEFAQLTEMSEEFEKAFLTDRNLDWAQQLASPSWSKEKKGTYLMVVGSLHLVGENNVLALLKEGGFKVTQLSQSKPALCEFEY
ncbi:TraB/GumN family protein [Vibrio aquaticus]|uniref:TraB/GumN family protein n=1 Tax=Vibrio aquaticus TaxID=2496559 RepID=A0A432CY87_9VIBR|nr:TraB/GumN family protein [Vibrio aquaticus]RTZ15359.1 TraB/GumN family protein [Vibrio aquaticus]